MQLQQSASARTITECTHKRGKRPYPTSAYPTHVDALYLLRPRLLVTMRMVRCSAFSSHANSFQFVPSTLPTYTLRSFMKTPLESLCEKFTGSKMHRLSCTFEGSSEKYFKQALPCQDRNPLIPMNIWKRNYYIGYDHRLWSIVINGVSCRVPDIP